MFDIIDCCLFIVYLYYTCSIRPEKMISNIVLHQINFKIRELKKNMREFHEKNNSNISMSVWRIETRLVDHKSYIKPPRQIFHDIS